MNFCSDDLHLHPCSMAYAAASHLPPNSPVWPLTIAPRAQLLLSACVTSANYQRTWMTIRRKERRAECMWQSAASFSPRSLPTPPTPPLPAPSIACARDGEAVQQQQQPSTDKLSARQPECRYARGWTTPPPRGQAAIVEDCLRAVLSLVQNLPRPSVDFSRKLTSCPVPLYLVPWRVRARVCVYARACVR